MSEAFIMLKGARRPIRLTLLCSVITLPKVVRDSQLKQRVVF